MSGSRARLAVACGGPLLLACLELPAADTLVVNGQLDREGVAETDLGIVDVDYTSTGARGEWWTCELRVTASSCVGQHHVNAWVALPDITDFDGVGRAGCASGDGTAFGAFELLTEQASVGDPVLIPDDVTVLLLVASDLDGDGSADLADDSETTAASRLVSGELQVIGLGSFDDPVSLVIDGQTAGGVAVHLEVSGPTTPVTRPPTLDPARTCTAP